MNFHNNRSLRVISTIVLALFIWTFCGIFEIAYAIDKQISQLPPTTNQTRELKSEEKFEKSIKDIEDTIDNLKKVKTHEELQGEKENLRQKRQEIEGHDAEIRSQFAETEEKIKNLPDEIKQRHRDFVKKYEENLNTLRRNLDDIEKAETAEEVKVEVDKAKTFLEKTKPPSKHTPLDPNKLPHRKAEPTKKKPRLKKEEFEKDLGQGSSSKGQGKPILVASIGDLQGILTNAATQALTPPTQQDLSETIEIQFTQQIKDLSASLQNNPVKIYEWVRNNIEFVPTYGSIQGADMCLQTKQCNAFDTASLLIALLRTSNIPAKYVYGTIEAPIDKVMNWVGGFTDANSALSLIASGGIPVSEVISGGKISAARMEHVWVEAYIPYGNYRGTMRDNSNKTWIPMDGSFKQYYYKNGLDLYSMLLFNSLGFVNEYVHDHRNITPYQDYGGRVLNLVDANFPDATIEDILGNQGISLTKSIIKKELFFLPGSLPYKVKVRGNSTSEIPTTLRSKVTFEVITEIFQSVNLSYSTSIPELRGARLTLSYEPASAADENLITQYGGIFKVPAYLLQLKPVLKKDGATIAIGNGVGLGEGQTFVINMYTPSFGVDRIENKLIVGSYSAIIIQLQKSVTELPAQRMQILTQNSKLLEQVNISLDDLLGEMLNNIGVSYFYNLSIESDFYAKTFQMVNLKLFSECIVSANVSVAYLFGVTLSVAEGGINIDVDRDISATFSITGDNVRGKDFTILSGISASAWEHLILETFYNIPSVSAVKLLKIASQQGIPIYQVDSQNIVQIIQLLAVSDQVKTDIQNAVNMGRTVTVSQANVQINDWVGVGYITIDSTTGDAAYLISGGLAGGGTSGAPALSPRDKASYLGKAIGAIKRRLVAIFAYSKIGTLYSYSSKDPNTGYIDCSGLVTYAYSQIGIYDLGTEKSPKDVQMQYDYVASINGFTTNPLIGDLIFFQGTYDKNKDGSVNNSDGVTHVGIYYDNNQYIAAQKSRGVDIYSLSNDPKNGNWGQNHLIAYGIVIP